MRVASQSKIRYFKRYPKVLIEVLSPDTESTDRREKFLSYLGIETLEEYLIVAQDRCEVGRGLYRRRAEGDERRDEQEDEEMAHAVIASRDRPGQASPSGVTVALPRPYYARQDPAWRPRDATSDRLHASGRVEDRVKRATVSTCGVCGNMSSGVARSSRYPCDRTSERASPASVAGSQET